MQTADALLLTSAYESGPTVAYEALAAGLPVISTPVGEVPRIVASGSTGWVTREFTPSELAAGLEWSLGEDRDAVAIRCAQAAQPFGAREVLQPFVAEHRRLAGLSSDRGRLPSERD